MIGGRHARGPATERRSSNGDIACRRDKCGSSIKFGALLSGESVTNVAEPKEEVLV
jgi:hypothetical protein